jgi:hypothetical protein
MLNTLANAASISSPIDDRSESQKLLKCNEEINGRSDITYETLVNRCIRVKQLLTASDEIPINIMNKLNPTRNKPTRNNPTRNKKSRQKTKKDNCMPLSALLLYLKNH